MLDETDKKPWYLSKSLWGALFAELAIILEIAGTHFDVAGIDNEIMAVISGILAIYGRIVATKRLR